MYEMAKYKDGQRYVCRPHDNGTFYIFWSENRRSRRTSTGTKDVSEAQAFFDEWMTLEAQAPEDMPCSDVYRIKYPEGENQRADAAWAHLGPVFGAKRVAAVTDADDAKYIRARTAAGAAKSTIRAELSMLRASWNYAAKAKLIPTDSVPALGPLPPQSPPRSRHLSVAETDKILSAAEARGRRPYLFCVLALNTAARRTAICDLKWDQVDFDNGVIHFLPEGAEQTRKRRASVPISAKLRPVLQWAYETRSRGDEYVIGEGGKINQTITRVAEDAGVEGVTPHVFRHTAATRMAQRGVSLWIIAKVLGNTVEQVEKVYAKWQPGAAREAVDAI